VIHRTFRSLDEAPKLLGFTMRQWVALIASSGAVLGLVYLAHLPAKPAITLFVFVIGLPAALTYVSESGGLQLGVLLRDMCRWRLRQQVLPPASPADAQTRTVVVLAHTDEPVAGDEPRTADPALEELLLEERWER
jgi:hypothetical protein